MQWDHSSEIQPTLQFLTSRHSPMMVGDPQAEKLAALGETPPSRLKKADLIARVIALQGVRRRPASGCPLCALLCLHILIFLAMFTALMPASNCAGSEDGDGGAVPDGLEQGGHQFSDKVDEMTVGELKEALRSHGLKVGGVKGLALLALCRQHRYKHASNPKLSLRLNLLCPWRSNSLLTRWGD